MESATSGCGSSRFLDPVLWQKTITDFADGASTNLSRKAISMSEGLALLEEVKSLHPETAVVVMTAFATVSSAVEAMRIGAGDYLTKPFALEELVARLQALMRRPGELLGRSLSIANVVFDTESHQIFVDSRPELFSARESAVLELLMRRQGRVVTKKAVEDQIFGMSSDVASNAVEVYVSRLRKHLTECRARLQIHTIRGVGYMIAEDNGNAQT